MTTADKIKAYLETWKAVDEAATKGPWVERFFHGPIDGEIVMFSHGPVHTRTNNNIVKVGHDMELISFTRNASPIHRAVIEKCVEALAYITSANVPIGNDENGILMGLPDKVMCRNKANKALAEIAAMLEGDKK